MNAPPPSCVTSTGVIDVGPRQLVVDLGVVHARNAERVAHADVLQRFAKQRCGGSAHGRPALHSCSRTADSWLVSQRIHVAILGARHSRTHPLDRSLVSPDPSCGSPLDTRIARHDADYQAMADVRIAVIGAGMAGLACASELARADAKVTVFERVTRARRAARDAATGRPCIRPWRAVHHGAQQAFRALRGDGDAGGRAGGMASADHGRRPRAGTRPLRIGGVGSRA